MARGRNLKGLEATLGYSFQSRALLERALTHASTRTDKAPAEDNERLEFLGDRVLGLALAEISSRWIRLPPKAHLRDASTGWCARTPAPRSRAIWISGPR